VLLTSDDVVRRANYRNAARTLHRLLDLGVVPVVNENDTVATDEITVGDNDRLAALVAHLVRADLLVLLSDVDGIYDGNPADPASHIVRTVRTPADLDGVPLGRSGASGIGRGGMVTKVEAATIAVAAGITTVVTSATRVSEVLAGADVGTVFHPVGSRASHRLLWLEHATTPRGRLRLDHGAVQAVVGRRMSLLAAGVTSVEGGFVAGDPVDLLDENGHAVARGLVNFDATELPGLLGRSTRDLAKEMGAAYSREVVHRDDLVLLRR
jgi:glutamate 5-kinase